MVKAALMARFQKFIVDLPSIVSQPTLVVGSQDGSRFVKATARQNVAEGYLLAHRHPEPAQLRGHIPPGLVHAVHHTSSGGMDETGRSEEHTSELQSRLHLVCRLLLEKKKKYLNNSINRSFATQSTLYH